MTKRKDAAAVAAVLSLAAAQVLAGQPEVIPITEPASQTHPNPSSERSIADSSIDLDASRHHEPDALDDTANDWSVRTLTLLWDNDGTLPKLISDSDRHYTNGAKIDLTLNPSAAFAQSVRDLGDRLDPIPDARVGVGLVIAQHIYTAFDIRVATPPPGSRPYAGYFYVGAYVQRASDAVHDHLELDVGVVGEWSGAEATQKFIHAAFPDQVEPLGWGTQLANELAINLRYQRAWRFQKATIGRLELDGIPRVGFDLGNVFVRANADLTLRLGFNLPDDFGPPRLLDYADATGSWDGTWGLYAYIRGGARAVARNIFLDGNTFANSRSVDKRPVVTELTVGLAGRYKRFEAGWSVTWLSEEFDTQGNGDSYGSLYAQLSFPF